MQPYHSEITHISEILSVSGQNYASPACSLSANTAVYQSASALVFLLSIPVLRERVSVLKITSVCLTVAGVTLVSVYGQTGDKGPEKTTPLGYVVCQQNARTMLPQIQ